MPSHLEPSVVFISYCDWSIMLVPDMIPSCPLYLWGVFVWLTFLGSEEVLVNSYTFGGIYKVSMGTMYVCMFACT